MAYEVRVFDVPSGVDICIAEDSLQYKMATGRTINGFYYDMIAHTATWNFCGTEHKLSDLCYDRIVLAKDMSGFCGFDSACENVDFFDAAGNVIFRYCVGEDADFPVTLGHDMILYRFITGKQIWWIYKGKRYCINVNASTEKVELGFYSSLYLKSISRLEDTVYDAQGSVLYRLSKHPSALSIAGNDIPSGGTGVTPLILERYKLIAVLSFSQDYCYDAVTLYDFNGSLHAAIPLPANCAAFHSLKLLEHTDIPVVAVYEELPDISRYFNNGVAHSIRPNMPMKLRWYELLPDDDGMLAMFRSGELYQGFRDIDDISLDDKHIRW